MGERRLFNDVYVSVLSPKVLTGGISAIHLCEQDGLSLGQWDHGEGSLIFDVPALACAIPLAESLSRFSLCSDMSAYRPLSVTLDANSVQNRYEFRARSRLFGLNPKVFRQSL
jgi:hypothetical protein